MAEWILLNKLEKIIILKNTDNIEYETIYLKYYIDEKNTKLVNILDTILLFGFTIILCIYEQSE
jgi:hypothetical protein